MNIIRTTYDMNLKTTMLSEEARQTQKQRTSRIPENVKGMSGRSVVTWRWGQWPGKGVTRTPVGQCMYLHLDCGHGTGPCSTSCRLQPWWHTHMGQNIQAGEAVTTRLLSCALYIWFKLLTGVLRVICRFYFHV
jgi:hypothetical protein